MTLALDRVEWLASRLGRYTPQGKSAWYPSEAGWAPEPIWSKWRRGNFAPAGNRTPAVQPVARRYTERAVPGLLPSKSYPIHYSQIILLFDAV
jgi:hypothetical protein